ncbi:hypothetical protein Pla175_37680 [Pirellulimonas nuda]|uniref:DUF3611 domain-containing protein n=1 Tax=Pirellulimonas nuda TaxID=2528009 RepID=A0A518DFW9_9BACT|nr:DUF3611 family protein [Pirellulimonas nuda]QDU90364.1 hypothetical protein Pla175_37680 [Pirellulimonas nuda]
MPTPTLESVAGSFRRLGWTGVVVQLALAVVPVATLCYFLFGKVTGVRAEPGVTDVLAIGGLLILLFTTFWSYRYASMGRRMLDPERRPPLKKVKRVLWTGLWAGVLGIVASMLLLIVGAARLLYLFMKAPQGGVPVIQTAASDRSYWVSSMDIVSLLAELCMLAGELLVVGFTLWLLYRVSLAASPYGGADAAN